MKNRLAIFSLCLLFPTARLGAQTAGAQTPAASKPDVMSSFEFVVGIWQPVADPAHPAKYVETLTYAPIHDGKFVASQQIYRDQDGKIIYKDLAVFGEDPDTHHLFFHAYNTDGSIDRSHAIDAPHAPPASARSSDSTKTETTTDSGPNPIARSVAISRERVLTVEYMVLSAPNIAPTAMIPPTT